MSSICQMRETAIDPGPAPQSHAAEFAPWPFFGEEEQQAALRVLRSGKVNYWTGQEGRAFEQEFARFVGTRHAVAVANGTVALESSLRALGIGPGDEVVTTSRSFFASASSIVAVGARPLFADVDRCSQNVTAATIERALTPKTRAIIAVHLAGWPCEMDPILALARARGIYVVEDCAQAIGSTYKGIPVGSLGDVAAFSFCQDKHLTTAGEGGMVTTDSEELWKKTWSYKDHGKNFDTVYHQQHPWGFRWLHDSFGSNWRLSEIQSAVGRVGLKRMPGWLAARKVNAARLTERLRHLPGIRIAEPAPHQGHSFYKYYAFVDRAALAPGWDRDSIAQAIEAEGVPCSVGSCSEMYLEKAFPPEWLPAHRLPVARELGETSLMFLVHPTLQPNAIERTCGAIEQVMHKAVTTGAERQQGDSE